MSRTGLLCLLLCFSFSFSFATSTYDDLETEQPPVISGSENIYISPEATLVVANTTKPTKEDTGQSTIMVTQGVSLVGFSSQTIVKEITTTQRTPKKQIVKFDRKTPKKQSVKTPAQPHKLVYNSLPSSNHFSLGNGAESQAVLSLSFSKIAKAHSNYFFVQHRLFSKKIAGDYTNPLVPSISFGGQYFTRPPTFL